VSDPTSASFVAPIFSTTAAAVAARTTTGSVGICLSGGGSRAMGAAMGQLQALELLTSGGSSLLSQVAAMSTVSGGGWIGIPFTYLPAGISDAQFLGTYTDPASLTDTILEQSPVGWIGGQVSSGFTLADLAVSAVYLRTQGVPSDMLWQTMMGQTFLQPYGLFPATPTDYQPATLFSYDQAMLQSDVTGPNPALANVPAYLVATSPSPQRPYLLSVASMFVDLPAPAPGSKGGKMLVPVQSTPILSGILPTPQGALDGNGNAVGGGAVTSFAFNSVYEGSPGTGEATIQQSLPWSLMDILGTSSCAYAATLETQLADWSRSPQRFAAALRLHKDDVAAKLAKAGHSAAQVAGTLEALAAAAETGGFDAVKGQLGGTGVLTGLIPQYDYWSPATPPTAGTAAQQHFADGGSLDNSGVTSMLLYPGVTKIIAFINTEVPLTQADDGTVIIDSTIPALFGLQAYDSDALSPYMPASDAPASDLSRLNQVFSSADFDALLDGLWASTGGNESMAPIFSQKLTTVANDWFGIPAGREVTMLWVYLGMSQNWANAITDDWVSIKLDYEQIVEGFPHYNTLWTERSPTQMNLLGNLTAWTVLQNEAAFTGLFG
jgi:hypothetical protein